MIESFFQWICQNADHAHYFFFALLLLAGLNVPISEDIILLTGGAIAHICIPEHHLRLYLWLFFGCWISAWEAYALGRFLGPKLYQIPWIKHFVNEHNIEKLHHYYERFGGWTFVVGRFVPGGVRNTLFMTAGLGKMPFSTFLKRDTPACLLASLVIFHIGYYFAMEYEVIVAIFKKFEVFFIGAILFVIAGAIAFYFYRKKTKNTVN